MSVSHLHLVSFDLYMMKTLKRTGKMHKYRKFKHKSLNARGQTLPVLKLISAALYEDLSCSTSAWSAGLSVIESRLIQTCS